MNVLNNPKKMIASGAKILLVMVVMAFLGLHSFNFFQFTFPADQWYYAFLGFGLTSGGVVIYLLMFKWEQGTKLQKTIALIMLVVSVIGELLTAGFGMQVEGLKNAGYTLTEEDFQFMILAVQMLGLFHGVAILIYFAGNDIARLFADDDGDGIPNIIDPVDNRTLRNNGRNRRPAMAHEIRSSLSEDDSPSSPRQ